MKVKNVNDVQICGVMAIQPISSHMPNRDNKDTSIQITFPVAWAKDGVVSLITVTAIQSMARKIQKYVQPGEPVLVTGRLVNRNRDGEDRMRCELSSLGRLVTNLPTRAIGKTNEILFLDGGQCRLILRGSVKYDCHEIENSSLYRNIFVVNDQKNRSHHFPFISRQPTYQSQMISLTGTFRRCVDDRENTGIIVAEDLDISEGIQYPAHVRQNKEEVQK